MDRRKALKQFSLILGGAIATPLASGFLAGCSTSENNSWKPKALTADQNKLVTIISELIIPQTDTPGAKMAKVNEFIDVIVADWFSKNEKKDFLLGLKNTLLYCNKKYKKEFLQCSADEQTIVLTDLENEFLSTKENPSLRANFLNLMKQFTLIGFYTSEIGATQELRLPLMGQYLGNEPFDENSTAWAW